MKPDLFEAPDYYNLDDLFTDEHILVRDASREWVKREVSPIIEEYAQRAEFPKQIIKGLAEIGAFGPYIPEEYGGAGLDQISYGLIMQEIERGDSGVRSTASVQSSLVMYPIWKYGNAEQRQKYLPKLASGEWMGSFGLTEPDHGSNPGGMTTNFKDMGDHYLLNGAKLWISNSPFCDVAVVWAKNEEGRIHGLIVERGDDANTGFIWDETADQWAAISTSETGGTAGNVTISSYANMRCATLTGTATAANYSDLAERYETDQMYTAGTVVCFGGNAEITQSTELYDSKVAGVISTNPAHLMNAQAGTNETHPAVALTGRVPCKVMGTVRKGDLMVTSAQPGVAMSADERVPGTIIGKAIQDYTDGGIGVIEILVTLM